MKITPYAQDGHTSTSFSVPDVAIANDTHIAQVAQFEQSNSRNAVAHTKTRGDVSGGGIKPWRQKGTGRARAGSSRSPLWRGGGITFGPRQNRNFAQRIPKKMQQSALLYLLAQGLGNHNFKVIDQLAFATLKTKHAQKVLTDLKVTTDTLIVLDKIDENTIKAFRNIPGVRVTLTQNLSVLDLMHYSVVLLTKAALLQLFAGDTTPEVTEPKKTPATKQELSSSS